MFFGGGGGGFPFGGGFEGMGGMGGPRGPKKEVDNKKFYESLGVAKNASTEEIKRAYKKLAIKHHPDKGGDVEKFQEISRANEVLSDPEKREMYDNYGEDGLREGGGGGPDMSDLLGSMFGMGGGGGRKPQGPKKAKAVLHAVKASLADLYNGKTQKVAVSRDRICTKCEGKGGKSGAVSTCGACRGKGMRTVM